jgi:prepilin-type N-terminal cleavage/methylation domain-containing protein
VLKHIRQRNTQGFTIVELLIVVVVIAILAAITIVSYNGVSNRAVAASLQSELASIARKIETAKTTSGDGEYVADLNTLGLTTRDTVKRAYYKENGAFCVSLTQKEISYYITNEFVPKQGLCVDNGFGTVAQTVFLYDTNQTTCAKTIQLPIATPTSAPGSTIDWGDGTTSVLTAARQSHTYANEGAYTVTYDGPIGSIDTNSVTTQNRGCLSAVSQWKTGVGVTKLNFRNSINLASVARPPTTVTDMTMMFFGLTNFNQPMNDWDVSNVTTMASMFGGATSFNQPLGSWNVSNVENFSSMFSGATIFNQPVGNWNTSKATTMYAMFSAARAFNQPISNWDTARVTTMEYMFNNASMFNQDLSSWNVSSVTSKPPFNFSSGASAWTLPKPIW